MVRGDNQDRVETKGLLVHPVLQGREDRLGYRVLLVAAVLSVQLGQMVYEVILDLPAIWDNLAIQVPRDHRVDQELREILADQVNLGPLVNQAHLGPLANLGILELRVLQDAMAAQVIVGRRGRVVQGVMLVHLDFLEQEEILALEEMLDPLDQPDQPDLRELLGPMDNRDSLVHLVPPVAKEALDLSEILDRKGQKDLPEILVLRQRMALKEQPETLDLRGLKEVPAPQVLRDQGVISGLVVLRVLVDHQGHPERMASQVLMGNQGLEETLVLLVKQVNLVHRVSRGLLVILVS